ncbi:MAG: hypothetical protein ACLU37_10240 [Collinsella sp.]
MVEPKIVVLDEPTSGLDYRECMTVMETVRTMAERGCALSWSATIWKSSRILPSALW